MRWPTVAASAYANSTDIKMAVSKNGIITSIMVILILLFIVPAQIRPENFLPDDSYYYLQVAYNIVNGHGSTFNQVTRTNGYHPLWMVLCIAGLFVSGGDKLIALHVILAMQALLFLGVVWWFFKIAKLISLRFWYVALPVLAAYFLTGLYGSEAHINALMLTLAIYYLLIASTSKSISHWIATSIFLGLAVLARLDNVFIIGALLFFGLMEQRDLDFRTWTRVFFAATLPCFLLIMSYLLYNFFSYGHGVPISGAIKSTFPQITARIDNLNYLGKIVSFFGLLSIIFSFGFKSHALRKTLLRAMGTGVIVLAGYVVLFTDHLTQLSWYYVSGVLNMVFLLCLVLEWIAFKAKNTINPATIHYSVTAGIVLLTVTGIARGWYKAFNPEVITSGTPFFFLQKRLYQERWEKEFAVWMKRNILTQDAILIFDGPGAIAYYSDLKILPMDGLMSDYTYNDELLALGIHKYLRSKKIGFYLGPVLSRGSSYRKHWMNATGGDGMQEIEVYAPLYRRSAGKIVVSDRNIVCRSRDVTEHPLAPALAIWKIENAGHYPAQEKGPHGHETPAHHFTGIYP